MVQTSKIMVIRHAEKPNGERGLMPDGSENKDALTATGWLRAEALVGYFEHPTQPDIATPGTIYASASRSLRPIQTVTPLANRLGLEILMDKKGNEAELVASAMRAGGTVLISWQHEAILVIANLIRGGTKGIPQRWPPSRFDLVWVFDRTSDGTWSFMQAPQMLLPGDSAEPTPVGQ